MGGWFDGVILCGVSVDGMKYEYWGRMLVGVGMDCDCVDVVVGVWCCEVCVVGIVGVVVVMVFFCWCGLWLGVVGVICDCDLWRYVGVYWCVCVGNWCFDGVWNIGGVGGMCVW